MKWISLCIPTNGISEWVFPVLDTIYSQGVDDSLFEVIVTDNGVNTEFKTGMLKYCERHRNLIYQKNDAFMFDNQLEALRLASGEYFKFLNHRSILEDGALQGFIDCIRKYHYTKPVIYFSNGVIKGKDFFDCSSFDQFIRVLKRNVSWTTGVGIWKEHYENLPHDLVYDKISPHSAILFSRRKDNRYLVVNTVFGHDIDKNQAKKGTYDLFKAFAVEEPTIALKLYIDGDITAKTLKIVLLDYKKFVSSLYLDFCISREPCSYDLSGFDDAMGVFFRKEEIIIGACKEAIRKSGSKVKRLIKPVIGGKGQ